MILSKGSKTSIWVTKSIIGFHCYPNAPEQVAYLRALHRHTFNVKVEVSVTDLNREIEFHMFLKDLEPFFTTDNFTNKSCEMIARELIDFVMKLFPNESRTYRVTVDEDGECGATVEESTLWSPFTEIPYPIRF